MFPKPLTFETKTSIDRFCIDTIMNTNQSTYDDEPTRRDFLYVATSTVGAIGVAATVVPLIAQMNPDASTIAAGGPVDLDISKLAAGQRVVVLWRSRPVFVVHRPQRALEMLQEPSLLS